MKKIIVPILILLTSCAVTKVRYCIVETTNTENKIDTIKVRAKGGLCISYDSCLVDFKDYIFKDSIKDYRILQMYNWRTLPKNK